MLDAFPLYGTVASLNSESSTGGSMKTSNNPNFDTATLKYKENSQLEGMVTFPEKYKGITEKKAKSIFSPKTHLLEISRFYFFHNIMP